MPLSFNRFALRQPHIETSKQSKTTIGGVEYMRLMM